MFDRVPALVHADLGRRDATLFEPALDRLQGLHEFPIELVELYLNLSVSLKRDLLASEEARQVNDEEIRALGILCHNPDKLHPTSLPLYLKPSTPSAILRNEHRDNKDTQ
jgi:hypothetical protein